MFGGLTLLRKEENKDEFDFHTTHTSQLLPEKFDQPVEFGMLAVSDFGTPLEEFEALEKDLTKRGPFKKASLVALCTYTAFKGF